MNIAIPLVSLPSVAPSDAAEPTPKEVSAARDFESLLIGQMLRSVREEDSGWLDSNDDAGATALGLGEEELAKAISDGGGFGLAKIIASGLAQKNAAAHPEQDSPGKP